jgi:ferredoxin, 2Fe-2S
VPDAEAEPVTASADGSVVVRVEPSGALIEVRPGESLMRAAERQGFRWPTVCHGQAVCTACAIVLDDHVDDFDPPEALELKGLESFAGRSFYEGKVVRLACQARPITDTVVTKRGVRPATS